MEIEKEVWEKDQRIKNVLVAVVRIAQGRRSVLTSYGEINQLTHYRTVVIASALKKLRREGVLAVVTGWNGTQITVLRKLKLTEPARI